MKPGEKWMFNWAIGGKKVIYDPNDEESVVDITIPELKMMKSMKGDFFIASEAFPPQTEAKWSEWGINGFYLPVFDLKMSANKASGFCKNEGGDLASIETKQEQKYLNSLIATQTTEDEKLTWFGLQYDNLWNTWGWTDGMYTEYQNWADGEPTYPPKEGKISFLKEPCAAMNEQGEWLAYECSRE